MSRKQAHHSFTEFERIKRDYFEQWLRAVKAKDFGRLCEVILIEELKNSIPRDTTMYLQERGVESETARYAGEEFSSVAEGIF